MMAKTLKELITTCDAAPNYYGHWGNVLRAMSRLQAKMLAVVYKNSELEHIAKCCIDPVSTEDAIAETIEILKPLEDLGIVIIRDGKINIIREGLLCYFDVKHEKACPIKG